MSTNKPALYNLYVDIINKINNQHLNIEDTYTTQTNYNHSIGVFHRPFIYNIATIEKAHNNIYTKQTDEFDIRNESSFTKVYNPYEELITKDSKILRNLFNIGYWDGLPITYNNNIGLLFQNEILELSELVFSGTSYYELTTPSINGSIKFDLYLPSGSGTVTILDLVQVTYPKIKLEYNYSTNNIVLTTKDAANATLTLNSAMNSLNQYKNYEIVFTNTTVSLYIDSILSGTLTPVSTFDWKTGSKYFIGANLSNANLLLNNTKIKNLAGLYKFGFAYSNYDNKVKVDKNGELVQVIESIGNIDNALIYQNDKTKQASAIVNIQNLNTNFIDKVNSYGLAGSNYKMYPPVNNLYGPKNSLLPNYNDSLSLATNFFLTYNLVNTDYKLGVDFDNGTNYGYLRGCTTLNELKNSLFAYQDTSYIDFSYDSTMYGEFTGKTLSTNHSLSVFIPFKLESSISNGNKLLIKTADDVIKISINKISANTINIQSDLAYTDLSTTSYTSRNFLISHESFHILCYTINHISKEMYFYIDGYLIDYIKYNQSKTVKTLSNDYVVNYGGTSGTNSNLKLGNFIIYDFSSSDLDSFLNENLHQSISYIIAYRYGIIL